MDRVLHGLKEGAKVRDYVEGDKPLCMPLICLTEIKSKYLREGKDPTTGIELIVERGFILPLDAEVAPLAAEVKRRYKLLLTLTRNL